jgi:16S rRNA (uracil1498-N3)-methyltransferase
LLTGPEEGSPTRNGQRSAHTAASAITLGPRILRGETACIAATALWMGSVGDWATI